jgi:hypothetical protein
MSISSNFFFLIFSFLFTKNSLCISDISFNRAIPYVTVYKAKTRNLAFLYSYEFTRSAPARCLKLHCAQQFFHKFPVFCRMIGLIKPVCIHIFSLDILYLNSTLVNHLLPKIHPRSLMLSLRLTTAFCHQRYYRIVVLED